MATINFTGTGGMMEGDLGTSDVTLNLDPSLTLDGTADYLINRVTAGQDFRTSDTTGAVTAWIKPLATTGGSAPANAVIFSASDEASGSYYYKIMLRNDGKLWVRQRGTVNEDYDLKSTTALSDDVWTHIAVVSTGTAILIYLNGVSDTVIVDNAGSGGVNNGDWFGDFNTNPLDNISIGAAYESSAGSFFKGEIADVRYYSDAITVYEVQLLASKINVDAFSMDNIEHHWKLNSATIDASNLGLDIGENDGDSLIPLTPTSIVAGSINYDEYAINAQDTATTDGAVTITTGKLESLSLTSVDLEFADDDNNIYSSFNGSGYSKITVSCWATFESTGNWRGLIFNTDTGGWDNGFGLGLNGSQELGFWVDNYTDVASISSADTIALGDDGGQWHHIVGTYDGTNQKLYIDGVLKDTEADSWDAKANSATKLRMGCGGGNSNVADYFHDGKFKDVRIYDYGLSADQVASLYSGSYLVTPVHWYKIDEGSGATAAIEDYGTGTDVDGTGVGLDWSNGTLDLDSTLTIGTNGTLSAPRGDLDLNDNFRFTDGANFTHNSGTVEFTGTNNPSLEMEGGHSGRKTPTNPLKFNNLKSTVGSNYLNLYIDFTVEDTFTISTDSLYGVSVRQPVYITMGTATSSGTIAGPSSGTDNLYFATEATGSKILATDTSGLNAWIKTGNDWGWSAGNGGTINLENGDYRTALDTGTGYYGQSSPENNDKTITLTGDMKFTSVIVGEDDSWDVNGHRMECSGDLTTSDAGTNGGSLDLGSNSLVYCTNFGVAGRLQNEAGANIIIRGDGAGDDTDLTDYYFVGDTTTNIMFDNGSVSTDWRGSGNYLGNLIIGSGTVVSIDTAQDCHNLTIATGATLNGDNDTITVSGDFTTSGGLIGKSAGVLDGTDDYFRETTAYGSASNLRSWTGALTVDVWFKSAGTMSGDQILASQWASSQKPWILYVQSTGDLRWAINGDGGGEFVNTGGDLGIDDQKWHHICGTYDETDLRLYLDGKLLGVQAITQTIQNAGNNTIFAIGAYNTNDSNTHSVSAELTGTVAKCSVWNHALTESEIRTMMFYDYAAMDTDSNFNTPQGDLKGWYQFDEGTGAYVDNAQGTANADLLRTGATWAGAGAFDGSDSASVLKMDGYNKNINYTGNETIGDLNIATHSDATCDLANNDATVTCNASAKIAAGMAVASAVSGFPAGATVSSVNVAGAVTSFELSANFTGTTAANQTLIFGGKITMNEITGVGTEIFTCESVTIDDGATFTATSGLITCTGESAANYTWSNNNSGLGNFNHNNGTVKVDFLTPDRNDHADLRESEFYNFEVGMKGAYNCNIRDVAGNLISFFGNVTITTGDLMASTATDDWTFHGLLNIASGGAFNGSSEAPTITGDVIHHGLITNLGTYKIKDTVTAKMNGGIRQLGTLTIA